MIEKEEHRDTIQTMRKDPDNPIAGIDLSMPGLLRTLANQVMANLQITQPVEANTIQPETQLLHFQWKDLPANTQERIKALIRYKLSLDYDPTMVDPEWRD